MNRIKENTTYIYGPPEFVGHILPHEELTCLPEKNMNRLIYDGPEKYRRSMARDVMLTLGLEIESHFAKRFHILKQYDFVPDEAFPMYDSNENCVIIGDPHIRLPKKRVPKVYLIAKHRPEDLKAHIIRFLRYQRHKTWTLLLNYHEREVWHHPREFVGLGAILIRMVP